MKTNLTNNLIACAVIGAAFTVGFMTGPATAQEVQPFNFPFSYDSAELASLPKAEKLLIRLESSVRSHCGGVGRMSHQERKQVTACINQTMKESIAKFDSSTVAQAYQSRSVG